jgi:hypothetical protein
MSEANNKLETDIEDAILSLHRESIRENESLRKLHIRDWKRNEEYWRGVQYLFWDDIKGNWSLPDAEILEELPRVINIIKAHGESIIAAISSAVPYVRFFPSDAENPDDLTTANEYSKASELVQKDNKARLLFIRALHILYTQSFVAAYNYSIPDEKRKITVPDKLGLKETTDTKLFCADCGAPAEDEMATQCPNCGSVNEPIPETTQNQVPVVESYKEIPQNREVVEVYGPLNIKVAFNARNQSECGYLILSKEENIAYINEKYADILGENWLMPTSDMMDYDRYGRQIFSFDSETANLITVHTAWFRPWFYKILGKNHDETIKKLQKDYPDGLKVIIVNNTTGNGIILEAVNEKLDDHWTISVDPLSPIIHSVPICDSLIPIQDIKNEIANLTIQLLEQSVPINIIDPEILDLEVINNQQVKVGMIYPGKTGSLRNNNGGTTSLTTATVPKELSFINQAFEQDGQFVSGDFPSVYGGPSEGGTKTLGEYQASRTNSLQRLSTIWQRLQIWWADIMFKSTTEFFNRLIGEVKESQFENGAYTNILVKKSLANGSIGRTEPDFAETFPISSTQKQDMLLRLIELQNPEILQLMTEGSNLEFVAQSLGYPNITIPGRTQRQKQLREIGQILQGLPVEPELLLDDDEVHTEILVEYLAGDKGDWLKTNNPEQYQMMLVHLGAHKQNMMMQQAMNAPPIQDGQNPEPTDQQMNS